MSVPSLEEIIAKEAGNAAVGTGHTVDDGLYEGTVESVEIDDYDVEAEELTPGSFTVKARGACTVRHSDSEHLEHVSDCDIEVEATVTITPTSHDARSSSITVKIKVDISNIAIDCSNDGAPEDGE